MDSAPQASSLQSEGEARRKKAVYEKSGVFMHIATASGEETQVPGCLILEEINDEAHVEWTPVRAANCADDEQGWALIEESSGKEKDEEYSHLAVSFKLADVVSIMRTEAVLEVPRMQFQLSTEDTKSVSLFFHSASPSDFWQCIHRYLILARSPSNANEYCVEGRTDSLTKSLHGLNFSPDVSRGIASSYFSTGADVLGGFSRVTQFMRDQLGWTGEGGDTEEMEEIPVPDGMAQACAENSLFPGSLAPVNSSLAGSLISTQPTASIASQPTTSIATLTNSVLSADPLHFADSATASASSPQASLISSASDDLPVASMSTKKEEGSIIVSEPTSTLTQRPLATSDAVAVAVSSDDIPDVMFESARSDIFPDEPSNAEHLQVAPSLAVTEPGATLLDLDQFFSREEPLNLAEWNTHLDSEGRVRNVPHLRRRIFKGGIAPEARPVIWKFLLGYHDYNSTQQERDQLTAKRREQYFALQQQWQALFPEQLKRHTLMSRRLEIIDKDVIRTDRTHPRFAAGDSPYLLSLKHILRSYIMYNFDLGYVQGMSDLLAPILTVMDDEIEAFWCFAGLMDSVEQNFVEDLIGMKVQLGRLLVLLRVLDSDLVEHLERIDSGHLYFCFRWLMVFFKREFHFNDVMRLWEVFWSRYLSTNFELFLAAAILTQQRQVILAQQMGSNDIITHINGLAEAMDADMMLIEAERLCRQVLSKPAESLPEDLRAILPTREPTEV